MKSPATVRARPASLRIGRRAFLAGLSASAVAGRAAAADPIRLGAVLPLTGPSAATGTQEQRGLQFAVSRVNASGGIAGRPLEILYEDGQAKPDVSVLAFNKLTDLSGVPVIFSGFSGPTLAMAPLASRKKVLLINGAAQADRLAGASPYLINTLPVIKDEIGVLARHLFDEGKRSAAILYQNDAAGTPGRDDFSEAFGKLGGQILGSEPSSFSQTDYRPALLKLTSLKAQVLFVMLTDGLSAFAEQVNQMKPDCLICGTSFFSDPSAMNNPGTNGWIHTQLRIKAPEDIAADFRKLTGTEMEFFGSQYFNAAAIVARSIGAVMAENAQPTGEAIRAKLLAIKSFNELIPTSFNTNTASMPIDIVRRDNGREVFVKSYTSE